LAPIETASAGDFYYPETRREAVIDIYHGIVVSDPYRWLEYLRSQEVVHWLDQQNKITDLYLNKTPQWKAIAERLTVLTKVRSKEYTGFRQVGGRSFVLYEDPAKYQTSVLASLQELDLATLNIVVDPRCVGDAACQRVDAEIAAKAAAYAFLFRELGMTVMVPSH
jgi:prolyl oligopeptidase